MTSSTIPKSTSLQAEASGPSQLDLPDGQTTDPSGQRAARASRSAKQAKGVELMTQGICGQTWIDSSMKAQSSDGDLLSSWENRLRARLAMIGSTESALIWRSKDTGHGWSISRLAPWTPLTSDSGSIGLPWRTPNARGGKGSYQDQEAFDRRVEAGRQINLNDEMSLTATWSTPRASDGEKGGPNGKFSAGGTPLPTQMHREGNRAAWITPSSRDWKDSPGMATERQDGRSRLDQLPRQMAATWRTPLTNNKGGGDTHTPEQITTMKARGQSIKVQDEMVLFGQTTNGSSATTEKRGAPNPAFAFWLMGFPDEWVSGALEAMRLSRSSRHKSSKPSSKPKPLPEFLQ